MHLKEVFSHTGKQSIFMACGPIYIYQKRQIGIRRWRMKHKSSLCVHVGILSPKLVRCLSVIVGILHKKAGKSDCTVFMIQIVCGALMVN
jgi:hypothetical protein